MIIKGYAYPKGQSLFFVHAFLSFLEAPTCGKFNNIPHIYPKGQKQNRPVRIININSLRQ